MILLCDDDKIFRQRLARAFSDRQLQVCEASCSSEALQQCSQQKLTHAVLDLKMPGESGLDLTRKLLELQPDLQIVILTGYGSIATAVTALKNGAVNYLTKPVDSDSILKALGLVSTETVTAGGKVAIPSLSQVEWDHIQKVVQDCQGNITLASKQLGLHRRSLQRKLAKYPPPLR